MNTDNETVNKWKELEEILRKAQEDAQKNPQGLIPPYQHWPSYPQNPCPSCGHCPHCGRGGYTRPYISW